MSHAPTRPPTTTELQLAVETLQLQVEQANNESIAMREQLEAAKRQAQAKIALPKKFDCKREVGLFPGWGGVGLDL